MLLRLNRIRRVGLKTAVILIIIFVYLFIHKHTPKISERNPIPTAPAEPAPLYNSFIDQSGNYVQKTKYKINQFVGHPLPKLFQDLHSYLSQQDELLLYFKLVPQDSYHVVLTDLENDTRYGDLILKLLKGEQEMIEQMDTGTKCSGKQLVIIDKQELRLEVELEPDEKKSNIEEYQRRWSQNFPLLVVQHHKSFYITLAYQYRDFPHQDVALVLDKVLRDWKELPTDIILEPIVISAYSNLVSHRHIMTLN